MRKAVYKIRRYLFGLSVMGAVASSPATLSGQVRAEGNGGGKEKINVAERRSALAQRKRDVSLLAYNRMIEIDVDGEIAGRAEWFVNEFLEATSKHLKALKKATQNGQKTKYVKNNFFDIVYPDGRLSGRNNYCIRHQPRLDRRQRLRRSQQRPARIRQRRFQRRRMPALRQSSETKRLRRLYPLRQH